MRALLGAILLLVLAACGDGTAPAASASSPGIRAAPATVAALQLDVADVVAAIGARLSAGPDPTIPDFGPTEQAQVRTLYEASKNAPFWIDGTRRPGPLARDALALLAGAAADGLDPAHYGSARLEWLSAELDAEPPPLTDRLASFDVALSAGVLRYLRHLHTGRVDPRTMGLRLSPPADRHDFVAMLRTAVANARIAVVAEELAPPLVQYRALRTMLARYRALAADTSLEPPPPLTATVRPGEPHSGLGALHRRLVAFGDLAPDAPHPAGSTVYEGAIVEGVRRFQTRHGLESDGVLGKATQAALQVSPAWRVRQIEMALERLRWLPDLGEQRFVALNIPMFTLWGWNSIPPSGAPAFGMRAIVGRALRTQTPVFVEEMHYVIFRPYWNVPPSILRNEILPILQRDPGYLDRQDMEIVRGPGDDAQPVAATTDTIALLRQGALRLRQRRGPRNALGLVKFVFPNDENVYLHGTPAQALFSRTRRDFSHGCVRVEDPVALAEWVLKEQPEWTREHILAAMSGTQSRRVNLTRPIQVILFYLTAVVMPEDGTIHFAEDIYGHDARLDRVLRAGSW